MRAATTLLQWLCAAAVAVPAHRPAGSLLDDDGAAKLHPALAILEAKERGRASPQQELFDACAAELDVWPGQACADLPQCASPDPVMEPSPAALVGIGFHKTGTTELAIQLDNVLPWDRTKCNPKLKESRYDWPTAMLEYLSDPSSGGQALVKARKVYSSFVHGGNKDRLDECSRFLWDWTPAYIYSPCALHGLKALFGEAVTVVITLRNAHDLLSSFHNMWYTNECFDVRCTPKQPEPLSLDAVKSISVPLKSDAPTGCVDLDLSTVVESQLKVAKRTCNLHANSTAAAAFRCGKRMYDAMDSLSKMHAKPKTRRPYLPRCSPDDASRNRYEPPYKELLLAATGWPYVRMALSLFKKKQIVVIDDHASIGSGAALQKVVERLPTRVVGEGADRNRLVSDLVAAIRAGKLTASESTSGRVGIYTAATFDNSAGLTDARLRAEFDEFVAPFKDGMWRALSSSGLVQTSEDKFLLSKANFSSPGGHPAGGYASLSSRVSSPSAHRPSSASNPSSQSPSLETDDGFLGERKLRKALRAKLRLADQKQQADREGREGRAETRGRSGSRRRRRRRRRGRRGEHGLEHALTNATPAPAPATAPEADGEHFFWHA